MGEVKFAKYILAFWIYYYYHPVPKGRPGKHKTKDVADQRNLYSKQTTHETLNEVCPVILFQISHWKCPCLIPNTCHLSYSPPICQCWHKCLLYRNQSSLFQHSALWDTISNVLLHSRHTTISSNSHFYISSEKSDIIQYDFIFRNLHLFTATPTKYCAFVI